jgi:hypothetical protein
MMKRFRQAQADTLIIYSSGVSLSLSKLID